MKNSKHYLKQCKHYLDGVCCKDLDAGRVWDCERLVNRQNGKCEWYEAESKYKNKSCKYGGRTYHSRREAGDALWLDSLLKRGLIKEVKAQHKIDLRVSGVHICNHYVDFLVTLNDGRQKFIETKGFLTGVWQLKTRLTRVLYDNIPYIVNPTEKDLLA